MVWQVWVPGAQTVTETKGEFTAVPSIPRSGTIGSTLPDVAASGGASAGAGVPVVAGAGVLAVEASEPPPPHALNSAASASAPAQARQVSARSRMIGPPLIASPAC